MGISIDESRENLQKFLESNKVGVLATATPEGKPHAATVYVTFDQELNIYFVTRKGTQKSRNLHSNNQAALAIYNAISQTTLQADGTVLEVTDPHKVQWVYNDIWKIATQTSPDSAPPQTQLMGAGDYIVYKISTPFIRLATFAQQTLAHPNDIFHVIPTRPETQFNAFDKRTD